jgi:bifunctional non-homologous end joining protein LigD
MPRFVIQEHYARSHHFDLRLERDGVLVSWAVPKGMPEDTRKNRLAMRVDDHDLSHLDLVDDTPVENVPGAVKKSIWDGGTYEAEEFGDDMVIATLKGNRLDGKYSIFRAGENWLIHKMKQED